VVHAVVEIDIRVSAHAVEEMVAARAERGVRGFVFGSEVGFDLDDAPRCPRTAALRDDDAAEEVARDDRR